MIKALVPLCKLPQTLSEGDLRLKSVVALQGGGIRIRRGHIARLHRHQLLVGLEVEILWQNASPHQFLLQDLHEVQQTLRLPATDVIDGIWRDGQTVFPRLSLGCTLHHPHDTLYAVIYICKIPAALAIIEDLDGLTFQQLIGKAEIGHIRSSRSPCHQDGLTIQINLLHKRTYQLYGTNKNKKLQQFLGAFQSEGDVRTDVLLTQECVETGLVEHLLHTRIDA